MAPDDTGFIHDAPLRGVVRSLEVESIMKTLWAILFVGLASTAIAQEEDLSILAQRGDGVVTQAEFDAAMARIPNEDQGAFLRSSQRFEQMVSNMLLYSQLAEEARKVGFDQDPVIQAQMNLAAEKELANSWLAERVETKDRPDLEGLAEEYYRLNPGEFMSQPAVDVSHILISNQSRSNEEALALAGEVRAMVLADPENFEALVAEYSEDSAAASNNGRYPSVKRGDMVRAFEDTAFALSPGELSEPVYTQFGYHIIRQNARIEPRLRPFEEVKEGLVRRELEKHRERVRLDYLGNLTHLETKITEAQLRAALTRYYSPEELEEFAAPSE